MISDFIVAAHLQLQFGSHLFQTKFLWFSLFCVWTLSLFLPIEGAGSQVPVVAAHL